MSTIEQVLARTRKRLLAADFDPSPREAYLLLGRVLGCSEVELLTHRDRPCPADSLAQLEEFLERRLAGEPIAYLFGEKEFYGRTFRVDDRVLIPRPETEHLIEWALKLPLPPSPEIVDIGTGSGCIGLSLALELPACRVIGLDHSLEALAVAAENRRLHALERRVSLIAADLTTGLDLRRTDLIISNPPYIGLDERADLSREIIDFEPREALFGGATGAAVLARLLREPESARPGCSMLLEIGARHAALLPDLAAGSLFECVEIRPDYAGRPRTALLRRR